MITLREGVPATQMFLVGIDRLTVCSVGMPLNTGTRAWVFQQTLHAK